MADPGRPWSDGEWDSIRQIVQQLDGVDEITGGFSTKVDARQTGFTIHVRFENRTDVMSTITVAEVFEGAGPKLAQILHRLLAQHDAANESQQPVPERTAKP